MLILLSCAHGIRASRDGGAVRLERRCSPSRASRGTEPETTFTAHAIHGGLAIDHMTGGQPTMLEPQGWFHWPGDPTLVMPGGLHPLGLWTVETGHVVVRDGITQE